ncbi:hypothetical protein M0805_004756 [Coniferiporia weirii]|nr:hypothetical protein M0805_004756 [Coniferiporia weirii]
MSASTASSIGDLPVRAGGRPGLKKIPPYWYPYRTNAKARWFDREILEVVSTEFRDRSVEYYRYALQSGVTTINGKIALPGTIIRNGDTLENVVHRHEPPVTSTPVEILYHDKERDFIVINKPGSIPVHAAGRYFKNSLVEILKDDFGLPNVYTVNRLDRLTSGLMIIALSADRARTLTSEFTSGTIRKEYVARVRGGFSAEEITCEEPLLTVDRQMGLNIVHPEGKEAKTTFTRMHYDKITDTSVVHCRPFTGRSHQIRVHLQYLGHPIANDTVYADAKIWGPRLGKGGIDLTPSNEREAPRPPSEFGDSTAEGHGRSESDPSPINVADTTEDANQGAAGDKLEGELDAGITGGSSEVPVDPEVPVIAVPVSNLDLSTSVPSNGKKDRQGNPAWRTKEESAALRASLSGEAPTLLPRETGHDIGLGAPVPLSNEAVGVITRLRNQKDEDEDWSRWRDIVFRAKGALHPRDYAIGWAQQKPVPKMNSKQKKGKRKGDVISEAREENFQNKVQGSGEDGSDHRKGSIARDPNFSLSSDSVAEVMTETSRAESNQVLIGAPTSAPLPAHTQTPKPISETLVSESENGALYCTECYLPLHPDPKPEKLYIFLHALRYTSASLGAFETRLPEWAAKGYVWE